LPASSLRLDNQRKYAKAERQCLNPAPASGLRMHWQRPKLSPVPMQ
jgi:hypothetical protein